MKLHCLYLVPHKGTVHAGSILFLYTHAQILKNSVRGSCQYFLFIFNHQHISQRSILDLHQEAIGSKGVTCFSRGVHTCPVFLKKPITPLSPFWIRACTYKIYFFLFLLFCNSNFRYREFLVHMSGPSSFFSILLVHHWSPLQNCLSQTCRLL